MSTQIELPGRSLPLLLQDIFYVSAPAGECTSFYLQKGKVCSQSGWGADLYRQEALPLVPDWSILMQMRTPNLCNLIGPKGTLLIGQDAATLIGQ